MSDIPKIVYDRLRASRPEGSHPDPDVLTAFAEQALSAGEREGVVRHLAGCRDCREVVALSIPAMEAVPAPERAGERVAATSAGRAGGGLRTWFDWSNLRWTAVAASVVVVASVLILRSGRPSPAAMLSAGRQTDEIAPAASGAKPGAPNAVEPAPSLLARAAKPDNSVLREKPELRMYKSLPGPARAQTPAPEVGALVDNKRSDSLPTDNRALKLPAATAATTGAARGGIAASEHVGGSAEQVVVSSEAANVAPAAPAQDMLLARSEPSLPIEKAKPAAKAATKEEQAELKGQLKDNETRKQLVSAYPTSDTALAAQKLRSKQSKDSVAQWSFAQGRLLRSLDGGATWQTALQLQHPLLSFGVRGSNVWAGGQAGTLFHSADSGTTWTMVQPSTKEGVLKSDIVAIEIRGPAEVALSTSDNQSWTTADGGKTWEKK
ncbi:MAG: YCF48-related protein [Terriglobales bacterium]